MGGKNKEGITTNGQYIDFTLPKSSDAESKLKSGRYNAKHFMYLGKEYILGGDDE
jgi:hypothetical protein